MSEVIGSILVFGLVIALISLLQVQAVPNANEEVEFEHSNAVTNDMANLRVAMSEAVDSGRTQESTVRLGVDYPPRLLFYNPPAATGRLQTSEAATMQLSNADADGNLGNYLATDPQLSTRALNYTVNYNELEGTSTRVREAGVYYEAFDDEALVKESTFIDGREISLVAIGGEYESSGVEANTVSAKALSAPAREYTIEDDGSPVTIEIPTRLPKSQWQEILADEYATNANGLDGNTVSGNGFVTAASYDTSTDPNTLTITLKPNEEYTLRLGKVGFGTGGDPEARYIVPVDDDDPTVATIEVRDSFNNPVSGVAVDIEATSETVTTGPNGRASYQPSSGNLVTFQRDFDGSGTPTAPLEKVTVSTKGPLDANDPTVDGFTVDVDETQTCDSFGEVDAPVLSDTVLSCTTTRTIQQPIVDFNVSDDDSSSESGVAFVEIQILDSTGDLITSRRFDGDGQAVVDSRWVGPWLDDGTSTSPNRPTPSEVKLIVEDRSGRTNSTTASL
ncbi:Ig-like domain-containing protein [Halorarius litoreus]|uniref:Ig-like domain-containing protein n=1 Tax=Halorarius litoreus TaxID=2962676 RepID=UPI0020CDE1C2|nr:Ig-like domain-containing protein [Halorarius litoreus]